MMKIKSIAYIAVLFGAAILTSCGDDDSGATIPPPSGGSDDGIYITGTATSATPSAAVEMDDAFVDAFGNTPPYAERPGLYESYIYMEAGEFNITQIDGEDENVWGGTVTEEDLGNAKMWVSADFAIGGDAFSITEAGLYHVTIDVTSGSAYINKINTFGLIGPAGPGWSADAPIAMKSADASSVVFEGTNIEMKAGEFKFRYNENWNSDRTAATPAVDGLNLLTNFGTDADGGDENGNFQPGGFNFNFAGNPGVYTVTLTFTPGKGYNVASTFERTGDGQPITFDPDSNAWAIIGNATPNGWADGPGLDHDFTYAGENSGTYTWIRTISLMADSAFKVRTNDSWDNNLGVGGLDITGTAASLFGGTDNVEVNASARQYYLFTLSTSDDGTNYTLQIDSLSWGMIGAATDSGWDASVQMAYDGMDSWSVTTNLTDDEFKVRANNDWPYNFGGSSLTDLEFNSGTNLQTGTSGVKTVTLTSTRGGDSYEVDIQ